MQPTPLCSPYVTGFWKITHMSALLIQRKTYFNNLKHCYSPALAATRMDFSSNSQLLRVPGGQGNHCRVSHHFR